MPTSLQNLSDETRDNLAQMHLHLSQNPETRKPFLGLLKKANPSAVIPELEVASQVSEVEKRLREEYDKKFQALQDERFKEDMVKTKTRVQQKFGLSDEDMKKMEERMVKKELPAQYEWAAPIFSQEITPVEPTNYGSSGFGPFDMPSQEGLMDNPHNWSLKTAHSMIDDIKRKGATNSF